MQDSLNRLYRTKLVLTSVLLVVGGGLLITLGRRLSTTNPGSWISSIPMSEFGGILVGAGLLSVWLDHFFRSEQQAIDELRLRSLLADQAPAMRDAVLDAFAANHADLERVSNPDTLDQIITNSLGIRLKDQGFAREIYQSIHDQAITASERWYDATLSIKLSPLPMGRGTRRSTSTTPVLESSLEDSADNEREKENYFAVTVRWEYTTTPSESQRRFVCVNDREEYDEISSGDNSTTAWFLGESSTLDPTDRESFELLRFTVDGKDRPIRRAERKTGQTYTVNTRTNDQEPAAPINISYTYRTVVNRHGNLLFMEVEQPTKNLRIDFDYTDCGIETISALDFVPTSGRTRTERSPEGTNEQVIRMDLDGWIFPRAGVVFVWTLGPRIQPIAPNGLRESQRS